METMEMPMTMSAGVASHVGKNIGSFESSRSLAPEIRPQKEIVTPSVEPEATKPNEEEQMADSILKSVRSIREDGFEKTLQSLSNGEFDPEKSGDEIIFESQDPIDKAEGNGVKLSAQEGQLEDETTDVQDQSSKEPTQKEERLFWKDKVDAREEELRIAKEKALLEAEKLKASDNLANQALLSQMEMMLIFHEMIKDMQDEEEQASFLEALLAMMYDFLEAVVAPSDYEKNQKVHQDAGEVNPKAGKSHGRRSLGQIVKDLQEQGMVRPNDQIGHQIDRGVEIENQAA